MSEYQIYVKENYARIRSENPRAAQKGIMSLLGKGYKEMKAKMALMAVNEKTVTEKGADGGEEVIQISEDETVELDAVARKLDFLSLTA